MPRPPDDPSRPAVCPLIFKPVCGADNQTYANDCLATAANVAVAAQGPCPGTDPSTIARPDVVPPAAPVAPGPLPTVPVPGGTTPPGSLASSPAGQPLAENPKPRLTPVPCARIYMPVCATVSSVTKTYPNDCEARAAGAAVTTPGECGASRLATDETLDAAAAAPAAAAPPLAPLSREPAIEEPEP